MHATRVGYGCPFEVSGATMTVRMCRFISSGDTTTHGRDSDNIVGDNGNILRLVTVGGAAFLTFTYDNYGEAVRLLPRAVQLLDYTPGGPDRVPGADTADIYGADEIHGEAGDDTVYSGAGNDIVFGDAGDDDLIGGGSANDGLIDGERVGDTLLDVGEAEVYGGPGNDWITGDNGLVSRNVELDPSFNRAPIELFDVLGLSAHRGRLLQPEDERQASDVVVLAHRLWERAFGADPTVVGRSLRINGHAFEVVGVAPPQLVGPSFDYATDLWLPITANPQVSPAWAHTEPLDIAKVPNAKNIDPRFMPYAYGMGVPISYAGIGIAYNKQMVPNPPKTWADLWKPEYAGKIGVSRPQFMQSRTGLRALLATYQQ